MCTWGRRKKKDIVVREEGVESNGKGMNEQSKREGKEVCEKRRLVSVTSNWIKIDSENDSLDKYVPFSLY